MLPERVSQNLDEIHNVLYETLKKKSRVLVWQKTEGKRQKTSAIVKSIHKENNSLVLEPLESSLFTKACTIYAKGEVRELLFKETLGFASDKLIIMPIPKSVRLNELRNEKRKDFKLGEKALFFTKNKVGKGVQMHELMLIDASLSGMSFSGDLGQLAHLNQGDKITIGKIGMMQFSPNITGIICYIRPYQQLAAGKKTFYRVGVKFIDRKLTELFY